MTYRKIVLEVVEKDKFFFSSFSSLKNFKPGEWIQQSRRGKRYAYLFMDESTNENN